MASLTAGLDLAAGGRDFSALAVVERVEVETERVLTSWRGEPYLVTVSNFLVRHLVRWPQGSDPHDVVHEVAALVREPQMRGVRVLYDSTGLGAGVRGLVRELYRLGQWGESHCPVGLSITGADESHPQRGTVAKVDLVSQLARLLQESRVHVARGLEHSEQLRRELLAMQVKVLPSGRERYEAATEGVHDDLVTALMLAVWRPNRHADAKHVDAQRLHEIVGAA